jgi:hypothetical protein
MTDPDYRALCAELVEKVEYTWGRSAPDDVGELLTRARALLAEGGKHGFVIRYSDGFYDLYQGYPVILREATRYNTREEAESVAEGIVDVDCIEKV